MERRKKLGNKIEEWKARIEKARAKVVEEEEGVAEMENEMEGAEVDFGAQGG